MINTDEHQQTLADKAGSAFARYLDGDPLAMGELVSLLTPLLWHTARAQRLDQPTAEDVVQTAWLQLVRHAGSIHDTQSVMQWLLVCVRREGWRSSGASRRTIPVDFNDEPAEAPQPDPTPDEQAIEHEESSTLWETFQQLPPRCRFLLRVVAFSDRPDYSTVAKALGMPIGSIGPTRGRCLAKLRTLLARNTRWEGP
jgi:RNA polymerase sigma factor (sigma-70 family)